MSAAPWPIDPNLLPLAPSPTLPADLTAAQALAALHGWHAPALPAAGAALAWVQVGQTAQLQPLAPAGQYLAQTLPVGGVALLGPPDFALAPDHLAQQVWAGFTREQRGLLQRLSLLRAQQGAGSLAVVGGAVRDVLLGLTAGQDLDLVVVGQPVEPLARALAAHYGAELSVHPAYGNATVHLSGYLAGGSLDLIAARLECYPTLGAAPSVWPATLAQDLLRRDFSLNALALRLTESGVFLHDPAGGLADLAARTLRPLHAASLHEDASRLLRGARLAARLGLQAHPTLLAQVPDALALAPHTPRLWAELRLSLSEPQPGRVLRCLHDWGAGELVPLPALQLLEALDQLPSRPPDVVYAAALLHHAPALAPRLGLPRALSLLERVRGDKVYNSATPEGVLRGLLFPPPYPPLSARELLQLGFCAGPSLGKVLAHLAQLRREGLLKSREQEREEAMKLMSSGL